MSLTPEERQRIYEEEKARVEARERAERELQQQKQAQSTQGCLAGCGLLFVVGLVLSLGPCSSSSSTSTTANTPTYSSPAPSSSSPNVRPLTAQEKKAKAKREQAEAERRRKVEAAAEAEAERKAREEYDADGLVLLLKTVRGEQGEYSGEITGTVVNRRDDTLSYAQITFNLYDASGAQVGTALANVNNLEPGGRWKFKASTFGTEFEKYRFSELSGF